jgi:hypothetical protein
MARRLKKKVKAFLFIFLIALPLCVFGVFYFGTPEPPEAELANARLAIAEARRSIEKDFIPQSLTEAEVLYDSAMYYWKVENEKFILKRDYSRSRTLAIRSEQQARVSPGIASHSTSDFLSSLDRGLDEAKRDSAQIVQLYNRLPLPATINRKYSQGIMYLREAELNMEQKNYKEARKKLDLAGSNLREVAVHTRNLLNDYFANLPTWKRWAEQTIRESAQNQTYAIIVDKFAARCFLYNSGKLVSTYPVELGTNWIGKKRYAGDKATPEGKYRITKKKDGRQTKYYKALLLNYPNDEDKRRYQEEVRGRTLPRYASIGGLIEIHGGGGKGVNWTDGCIACADNDMDKLYRVVPVGCPVTIIGSLESLEVVKKRPKP